MHFHYDSGDGSQKLDLAAVLGAPDPGAHLYVCGPKGFIDYVLGTARAQGWPAPQLHVEYFSAAAVDTSGDPAFDVKLASSGKVVTVPPGQTVIKVLAEHGVEVPYPAKRASAAPA